MELTYTPYTLEFKRPFTIAAGSRTSTPVVITRLTHHNFTGYGEASMPPYLGESHESVIHFLERAKKCLEQFSDPLDLENIINAVDGLAAGNTAAKAAVDIALHDLAGKLQNKSCYAMWNLDAAYAPFSTYTIGMDAAEVVKQKVKESGDFKILKVKLGGAADKEMIGTIRAVSDKPLVVDVNQGWKNKEAAMEMIEWLSKRNVLFVEQPLPKNKLDDMAWITERSPVPIIADESVQRYADIGKTAGAFSGINIKLMKCTGLNEAYRMIRRARELNLKVLIGCMSETSCAISAAAQLSPLADWADLDGAQLIKEDLFEGITFADGKIVLNGLPGIGVKPVANEKR